MPYKPHRDFETPPDKAKLWRYMDIAKLIFMFSDRSLFFSRGDKLGDSWEGALSPVDVRRRHRKLRKWGPESMNDRLSTYQSGLRRRVYVSCWHNNSGESLAMWKLYADKGIAVQTTVARLKAALAGCAEQTIYIGKVEYLDYSKTGGRGDHELIPFAHKRRSFAFEREVRALFREPSKEEGDDEPLGESGFRVPIDADSLIETIYVAPTSKPWEFEAVRSLATKYELGCEVRKSALDESAVF
jgi:hypothetical protein